MTPKINDLTGTLDIVVGMPMGAVELLLCRDGAVRLAHDCVRVRWDLRVRQAPLVYHFNRPANMIALLDHSIDRLTFSAVMTCSACKLSGLISQGRWWPVAPPRP